MSVLDTLTHATPSRRTIKMCVDSAVDAEWNQLRDQLEEAAAQDQRTGSLAMENTRGIVDQMETMRERVAASEVTFTLEQLEWTERLKIQALHPPRKDHIVDSVRGYNTDTYIPAIIKASVVSVTGADGDEATDIPDDVWTSLLGDPDQNVKGALNFGQVERLYTMATAVNDTDTRVPSSARFLLGSQASEASSQQRGPGTSPRSGSAGGSRRGSPTSSATKKAASSGS